MPNSNAATVGNIGRDFTAGLVVFLVALPWCLGVALASRARDVPEVLNVPLFAGLLAGILGGIIVGLLSGSQTSVSGPAAGLTTIVAIQVRELGSFDVFLLALVIGGIVQVGLGVARGGILAGFFPSSVIKGLLAAIGVILVLKQIPHLLGRDTDPEGDMAFFQPDQKNTVTEILALFSEDLHIGAAIVGISSVALMAAWNYSKVLKNSSIPVPLVVVMFGVGLDMIFEQLGGRFDIQDSHLVQVPVADGFGKFMELFRMPDFSHLDNFNVYKVGITIAIVASLETLLNLNAVEKLDPQQRAASPNRELVVQGIGNTVAGLFGGIPITSYIVGSSVNINAGGRTKLAAVVYGVLLLVCVMFLPTYLNMIPLSCVAAILLVTGVKLASPILVKQMWAGGLYQFAPFLITLFAIVFTDLLVGILIGLAASVSFIMYSNLRRPLRRVLEKHIGGDVLRIELASQVTFLNRAALEKTLRRIPRDGHVLLDATRTDYIDPDVLDLIRDFKETIAPAHGVQVSLRGFRERYLLQNEIQFVDFATRELQEQLTAGQVLQILMEGNERFRTGRQLTRDSDRARGAAGKGQHPIAVILSCIDSRSPAELIFDLGLGDIFSVRVAGNVISPKVLGSMEYSCVIAGAKLILVLGHTQCGAVAAAVNLACSSQSAEQATGCQHIQPIVQDIQESIDPTTCHRLDELTAPAKAAFVDDVARRNVRHGLKQVIAQSNAIAALIREGKIALVGALYDVATGTIEILPEEPDGSVATSPQRKPLVE